MISVVPEHLAGGNESSQNSQRESPAKHELKVHNHKIHEEESVKCLIKIGSKRTSHNLVTKYNENTHIKSAKRK